MRPKMDVAKGKSNIFTGNWNDEVALTILQALDAGRKFQLSL
jgi:hypothetical protein